MATSNIQQTGLENSIYFIEDVEGYDEQYDDLKDNIRCENYLEEVEVFDRAYKEWTTLSIVIKIAWCYYDWVNLIIICDQELDDLDLSKSSLNKIDRAIARLEKIMKEYSTELRCTARFSNGETIYEEVDK